MGSVYLRGNSYIIKYKDENGVWKRKAVGKKPAMTKTIAKAILIEIERKVMKGEHKLVSTTIPTLREYATEYVRYQRDIKQIRSYDRTKTCVEHCARAMGHKKLSDITTDDIDQYKQQRLASGVKKNTIARELQVLRNLFNHAYKRDKFFGKNPVAESGLPTFNDRKERVLTRTEEQKLLTACVDHLKDVILIALNTGMRRGEILGLRWGWIDLDENIITLPHTHTKTNTSRQIPINDFLRSVLLQRKLMSGGSEFVFPSQESRTGHLTWLKRSFKTACQRAGIEGLRFHDLRHTAATRLVEGGIPLHTVAKLLGHSTVRVTERYSHPEQSLVEAVRILKG